MYRILVTILIYSALASSHSSGSTIGDEFDLLIQKLVFGGTRVTRTAVLAAARSTFPETYFKDARWTTKKMDFAVHVQEESMDQEAFEKKFIPITQDRAMDIYYIVGVTQMLFKEVGIRALPVGGTMLGMLRNKGQLPHDDDADFAILEDDLTKVILLASELKRYGLKYRIAPGYGLQITTNLGKSGPKLVGTAVGNVFRTIMNSIFNTTLKNKDLTKRAFIDIMPIKFYEDEEVYRYSAALAEEIWWKQVIPKDLFEEPFETFEYGMITIDGPRRELSEPAILEAYPYSLTHVAQTVDHRGNQNPEPYLYPLTEDQVKPFMLNSEYQQRLDERLESVGLVRKSGKFIRKELFNS